MSQLLKKIIQILSILYLHVPLGNNCILSMLKIYVFFIFSKHTCFHYICIKIVELIYSNNIIYNNVIHII